MVNRTPEGRMMWDVVRDYILKNKGEDDVLKLEKINDPKLIGVNDNPGIADYQGKRPDRRLPDLSMLPC
ncbi:MAG: hypothetical protein R3E89_01405 [Thiolinea sp.]